MTQPCVNGDPAVVNNGTDVTYTPDADFNDFNGTDSFTYTVDRRQLTVTNDTDRFVDDGDSDGGSCE